MNSVREYVQYIDRDMYANSRLVREEDMYCLFNIVHSQNSIYDEIIPVKVDYISHEVADMTVSGSPFIIWNKKTLVQGQTYQLSIREIASIIYDYSVGADLKIHEQNLSYSQHISSRRLNIVPPTNRLATLSNHLVDKFVLNEKEASTYEDIISKCRNNKGVVKVNVILIPTISLEEFSFLKNDSYFIAEGT